MKKLITSTLVIVLLMASGAAFAAQYNPPRVWDDLSWWGTSGATPEPFKDPERSGYWWWPTEPASNVGDAELWGNRGVVYHIYSPPEPPAPTPPPPPPPPPAEPEREVIQLPVLNHVLFDFDRAVLKPEGRAETDKVVAFMNEFSQSTVLIEGHTCNIGTADYNMGLGQRRADSVRQYLLDSGISADRVATQSFGLTQPAVPNDSPANRRLNRRAVFQITINE